MPIIALPDSDNELSDMPDNVLEEQNYISENDVSEEEDSRNNNTKFDNNEATRRYKYSKEVLEL